MPATHQHKYALPSSSQLRATITDVHPLTFTRERKRAFCIGCQGANNSSMVVDEALEAKYNSLKSRYRKMENNYRKEVENLHEEIAVLQARMKMLDAARYAGTAQSCKAPSPQACKLLQPGFGSTAVACQYTPQ